MSMLLYATLSRRGTVKLDRISREERLSFNKISSFVLIVQALLWVYFMTKGVIIGSHMSTVDNIVLIVQGFICLYSFLCCLVFLGSYGWKWLNVVILFTLVFLSILSCIYLFNVEEAEKFEVSKTDNISAKIVSKGTWNKADSFVLVSGDDVLTYKDIHNYTDFKMVTM